MLAGLREVQITQHKRTLLDERGRCFVCPYIAPRLDQFHITPVID